MREHFKPKHLEITEQVTSIERMRHLCLKAELNYLCCLDDMVYIDSILTDPRIIEGRYIKDNKKCILLFKSADPQDWTKPVYLPTSNNEDVPLTYGAPSHLIVWSQHLNDIGMILADSDPTLLKPFDHNTLTLMQKTPRYIGKPLTTTLPTNTQDFKIKHAIEWYKTDSKYYENEGDQHKAKKRYDAKLHKLSTAMKIRNIDISNLNKDPYECLYFLLMKELTEKLFIEDDYLSID